MAKEMKVGVLGKKLSWSALVVAALMLVFSSQPARAQYVVTDPTAIADLVKTFAQDVETYAVDIKNWVQSEMNGAEMAIQSALNNLGQELQVKAQSQIADTAAANARTNVDVQTAENISVAYTRPSYYSWCHVAQSTAMQGNNEAADNSTSQAFSQGNQNRLATSVQNSMELKNECNLCFAPVSDPNDPEYSAYKALGCTPCGGGAHVRQDRNLDAVLNPLEYLVDPALAKPNANGTYAPLAKVSGDQYYPFVAALTFCQHIVPYQKPPVKAVANKPTIDLLSMSAYTTAESQASMASSACFKALTSRMQFDNTTNWPASQTYPAAANIHTRHDEQVASCTEDNAVGIIDDSELANCQQYGRSELQAKHDESFKLASSKYQTTVLAVQPAATESLTVADLKKEEKNFNEQLQTEKNQLMSAIGAVNNIPFPGVGNASQPISQSNGN